MLEPTPCKWKFINENFPIFEIMKICVQMKEIISYYSTPRDLWKILFIHYFVQYSGGKSLQTKSNCENEELLPKQPFCCTFILRTEKTIRSLFTAPTCEAKTLWISTVLSSFLLSIFLTSSYLAKDVNQSAEWIFILQTVRLSFWLPPNQNERNKQMKQIYLI